MFVRTSRGSFGATAYAPVGAVSSPWSPQSPTPQILTPASAVKSPGRGADKAHASDVDVADVIGSLAGREALEAVLGIDVDLQPLLRQLRLGGILRRSGAELLPDVLAMAGGHLLVLDISGSHLGVSGIATLARGLSHMTQLEGLDISECGIPTDAASAVLSAVCRSPHLRSLRIGKNPRGPSPGWGEALAAALPALPALATLHADGTLLWDGGARALARAFRDGYGTALEEVHLARTGVGEAACAPLGAALASLPRLRRVDLSGNFMWAGGAKSLAAALLAGDGAPALEALVMSSNDVGDAGVAAIAEALPAVGRRGVGGGGGGLTELVLVDNGITEAGALALAAALPSLVKLAVLDLSGNPRMGPAGVSAIAAALRAASPGVSASATSPPAGRSQAYPGSAVADPAGARRVTSRLAEVGLGMLGGSDIALAAKSGGRAFGGRGPAVLASLDLSGCGAGAEGVVALAAALASTPQLTSLRLADNACGNTGAAAVCAAAGVVSRLTRLDLSGNALGDPAVHELAGALRRLPALTDLGIGRNAIGPPGVRALAGALSARAAPHLTRLDISSAALGGGAACDAAAGELSDALRGIPALAELDLGGCGLGPPVARALTDAGRGGLDSVPRLAILRLRGNGLGDAGAAALARAVWRGALPSLTTLDIAENGVGDAGGVEVRGEGRAVRMRALLPSSLTATDRRRIRVRPRPAPAVARRQRQQPARTSRRRARCCPGCRPRALAAHPARGGEPPATRRRRRAGRSGAGQSGGVRVTPVNRVTSLHSSP